MRRGDYGYDAPYFAVMFGFLSVDAGPGAAMSRWQGVVRLAVQTTIYVVFFLGSTGNFLHTARRGKAPGNARNVTPRNAFLEGASDCVQIETSDRRALPLPDVTFDLVISSLAIHNIRSSWQFIRPALLKRLRRIWT